MNEKQAKELAEKQFLKLNNLEKQFNLIHCEYMISAINELTDNKKLRELLIPLAWVHDIGKVISDENHAEHSLELLKEFNLNEIEKDCILNHGISGKPVSEEAKIFQTADGISLFYPEFIKFRFFAEAKEGKSSEETKEDIKKMYNKYLDKYKNRKRAIEILKNKVNALNIPF